jgi:hypothetical protein
MNKRYVSLASMMTLCFLLLLISGCGSSSNKESGSAGVSRVGETSCITCHSTSVERLTGAPIVANYTASTHNLHLVGCQDCHGGGASHEGKGPIPYASPNEAQCKSCHDGGKLVTQYAASKHKLAATEDGDALCNRCHTHQGAVLSAISHFTGDGPFMAARVGAPGAIRDAEPIKCNTCHDTHNPKTLRVDNLWNPSVRVGVAAGGTPPTSYAGADQYRLCTQCHGYITPAGKLMGSGTATSGTARVGYHETSWYRIIASTHYDDPTTQSIEGWVMRTSGANAGNPCLDCHGHEANAGTRYGRTTTPTIYTDWGQSGHAGKILKAKYAAADANPVTGTRGTAAYTASGTRQVDAVMRAGALANIPANAGREITPFTVDGVHEYWSQDGEIDCQRCHTSTGLVNYLSDVAGYRGEHLTNDYSHLAGWQRTRPTTPPNSAMQQEVLYCWGCHSNAGSGALRKPGKITPEPLPDAAYTFNGRQVTFPDVAGSNICVACHSGYGNRERIAGLVRPDGSANSRSTSTSPRFHYKNAAGSVFNEQAHIVYEFDLNGNGNFAEHYTNPTYFAHNKIGLPASPGTGSNGPCVACHMAGSSHTFVNVTKNAAGVITAITNPVCGSCHDSTHGLMTAAKLEEEKGGFMQADTVLNAYVANTIRNYHNKDLTKLVHYSDAAKLLPTYDAAKDVDLLPENSYGTMHNRVYARYEKAAYTHNRIYAKRIIFDSIDWLDNGAFDGTITINATTYPKAAAWFGAPAGTTGNYSAKRP